MSDGEREDTATVGQDEVASVELEQPADDVERAEQAVEQVQHELREARDEGRIDEATYQEILRQIRLLREDLREWRRELRKSENETSGSSVETLNLSTFETPPPPPPANPRKRRKKVLRFRSKK